MEWLINAIESNLGVLAKLARKFEIDMEKEEPHSWTRGYYQGVRDGYNCARSIIQVTLSAAKKFAKKE